MLLATSRIWARPVTFNNNFDKYNARKGPRVILSLVNVLQSPTGSVGNSSHFSNVRLRDFVQWTTEPLSEVYVEFRGDHIGVFRANLRWFSSSGSARCVG